MKYIYIVADTNDGDYVAELNKIDDEDLALIQPLIDKIKNFEPYKAKSEHGSDWTHSNNFPNQDCCREDLGELSAYDYYLSKGISEEAFELFMDYCPRGEYGIHTIVKIKILNVESEEILL